MIGTVESKDGNISCLFLQYGLEVTACSDLLKNHALSEYKECQLIRLNFIVSGLNRSRIISRRGMVIWFYHAKTLWAFESSREL